MPPALAPLPIDPRLPEVVAALREAPGVVLVAEPGAGKTTRLPRALLDAGFAERGEIVVLEPRRLATRMAARRVAEELGERAGQRIGYQVRFEDETSAATRVRFVTEGILTRRLAADPALRGVGTVVLDEFHERHLHADVALALLRAVQKRERPDLRLVVMSATLEADPVATFLDGPAFHVPGRRFDVTIEHAEKPDDRHLDAQVAAAIRRLVAGGLDGDVLVFLPGAGEIRRAADACADVAARAGLEVAMLHGDLSAAEQDRAVRRGPRPKIILSTNVAETSVTIEGVVAVVDSGLARVARHSPWSGLPSLDLAKISRASAAQRAGRAGRTRPGRCLRLYTKHDHDTRPMHDDPEIRRVDLAETVLVLRSQGHDPRAFPFFEAPPAPAIDAADALLERLSAIDARGRVTDVGRRILALPLHPRLGRLVLEADARGDRAGGCLLAALLGEREIRREARTKLTGGPASIDRVGSSDLLERVDAFEAAEADGLRADRIRALDLDVGAVLSAARARDQIERAVARAAAGAPPSHEPASDPETPLLVATLAAFPDRVGRRREPRSADVVFAGGGSGKLAPTSVVREAELLVAVDADERRGGGTIIRVASAIEAEWLLEMFPDRIAEKREVRFDAATESVEVVLSLAYDGLALDESRRRDLRGPEVEQVLAEAALAAGPERFCDGEALARLRQRIAFAARHGLAIPPIDDAAIRGALAALAAGRRSFAELRQASLLDILRAQIDPALLARLERFAPEAVAIPGRARVAIQYEPDRDPYIESRLQDFFSMRDGPRIAEGRVPLVLHLLAPNQRAVQVTTDLSGFWDRHYPTIRKELMRKYPRHSWPDDPRTAAPGKPGRRP